LHAETAVQTVSTHAIRTTSDLIRRNPFTANRFACSISKRPGRINSAGTLRHQTIRVPARAQAPCYPLVHPVLQVLPERQALPVPEPLPVLQARQVLPGRPELPPAAPHYRCPAQDCFGCKQPKPTPQLKR
jgi:hypothetical protein